MIYELRFTAKTTGAAHTSQYHHVIYFRLTEENLLIPRPVIAHIRKGYVNDRLVYQMLPYSEPSYFITSHGYANRDEHSLEFGIWHRGDLVENLPVSHFHHIENLDLWLNFMDRQRNGRYCLWPPQSPVPGAEDVPLEPIRLGVDAEDSEYTAGSARDLIEKINSMLPTHWGEWRVQAGWCTPLRQRGLTIMSGYAGHRVADPVPTLRRTKRMRLFHHIVEFSHPVWIIAHRVVDSRKGAAQTIVFAPFKTQVMIKDLQWDKADEYYKKNNARIVEGEVGGVVTISHRRRLPID